MRHILPKNTTALAAVAVAATGGIAVETAAPQTAEAASTGTTSRVTANSSDCWQATKLASARVNKTPYRYGGTSLWTGADCSGFVQTVFKKQGVSLPRTAVQQKSAVRKIHRTWLRAGDLVFYGSYHVGVYVGNGYIVDAPSSGRMAQQAQDVVRSRTYGTLRPA